MSTFGQHYLLFPSGSPTQGDIWSNLPFPTLHPASGLGLIITPRCDFAHEKTAVFNYIPAIALSTFLATATHRLLEREMVRLHDQLRSLDLSLPASALLEIGVPPKLVLPKLEENLAQLSDPSRRRRISSAVDRFREILEKIEAIEELLNLEEIQYPQAKAVVGEREVRKFQAQVVRNQLQDLHTLPPCPGAFGHPLVLLLRYVTSCDIRCLQEAHACPTDEDWTVRVGRMELHVPPFRHMPAKPELLARVRSPYMENIAIRIAVLFARVGVPDFSDSEFESLISEE